MFRRKRGGSAEGSNNLQGTDQNQLVEDFLQKTYHQIMAQQPRSDKNESRTFYALTAASPLVLIQGAVPFQMSSAVASFSTVVMRVFQNNDRGSTWLAFGLVWIMCATFAVGSAYVVFCVSETRKRILGRAVIARDSDQRSL
jgi:hypothetical protein